MFERNLLKIKYVILQKSLFIYIRCKSENFLDNEKNITFFLSALSVRKYRMESSCQISFEFEMKNIFARLKV